MTKPMILTLFMLTSTVPVSAADGPTSATTKDKPKNEQSSVPAKTSGAKATESGWHHFGETPQAPARKSSAPPQRVAPRTAVSGAKASAQPTASRPVAPRPNGWDGERPRATNLLYQQSEIKARPVFALRPGIADQTSAFPAPVSSGMAREVEYSQNDIIPVRTRLRYTTVIALPAGEQIMDFVIGDKDNWIVNGAANLAYVKPAKASAATNLNLVSTHGIVYSFLLAEVGEGVPDLKLFLKSNDETINLALNSPAKFIAVDRIEEYRQQAEIARNQAREAQQAAQKAVESQVSDFKNSYPALVHSGYRFERNKKPFEVTDIFNDGKFTYIKAHPAETPTLYEVKDGTPSLVNFEYRDGTYIVGKVLESGYLAIGKRHFIFTRER